MSLVCKYLWIKDKDNFEDQDFSDCFRTAHIFVVISSLRLSKFCHLSNLTNIETYLVFRKRTVIFFFCICRFFHYHNIMSDMTYTIYYMILCVWWWIKNTKSHHPFPSYGRRNRRLRAQTTQLTSMKEERKLDAHPMPMLTILSILSRLALCIKYFKTLLALYETVIIKYCPVSDK